MDRVKNTNFNLSKKHTAMKGKAVGNTQQKGLGKREINRSNLHTENLLEKYIALAFQSATQCLLQQEL